MGGKSLPMVRIGSVLGSKENGSSSKKQIVCDGKPG